MSMIRVCYDDIVNHYGYGDHPDTGARFQRNYPEDENEWLVSIPWDLDVESRKGLHRVSVRKKDGKATIVDLKEKVYQDKNYSLWRFYGYNEIDFYKAEDATLEECFEGLLEAILEG